MKLVFYICSLFFLYSTASFAAREDIEKKIDTATAKIKEVQETPIIQDIKRAVEIITAPNSQMIAVPDDTDTQIKMDVCVECADILKLTESVNAILKKMTINDPNSFLALEVGNLEAVAEIVEYVDAETNKSGCLTTTNPKLHEDFINFQEEDLIPIFTVNENIRFSSMQFRKSTGAKTIWLRGKGEDIGKVIKVDFDQYGESSITYYKLQNVQDFRTEVYAKNPNELPSLNSSARNEQRDLTNIASGDLEWSKNANIYQGEDTQVTAKLGSSVEYEYFLPTKVTLVDFETAIKSGDTKVSSDIEIASDVQQATIKIEQENFHGTARINLEKEFEVGAGIKLNVVDDLTLDTYTTYSSTSAVSVNSRVLSSDEHLFTSKYEKDQEGIQKISIEKEKQLDRYTRISVKVEKTIFSDNITSSNKAVWLNFTRRF